MAELLGSKDFGTSGKDRDAAKAAEKIIQENNSPGKKSSGPENTNTADVVPKIEKDDETGVQSKPAVQPTKVEPAIQKAPTEGSVSEREKSDIPSNGATNNSKVSKIDQVSGMNPKAEEAKGSVNGSGEIAETGFALQSGKVKAGENVNAYAGITKATVGSENQFAQSRDHQKIEPLKFGTEKPDQAQLAGNQTQARFSDTKPGQLPEVTSAGAARNFGSDQESKRLEQLAVEKRLTGC